MQQKEVRKGNVISKWWFWWWSDWAKHRCPI